MKESGTGLPALGCRPGVPELPQSPISVADSARRGRLYVHVVLDTRPQSRFGLTATSPEPAFA